MMKSVKLQSRVCGEIYRTGGRGERLYTGTGPWFMYLSRVTAGGAGGQLVSEWG